MRNVLKPLEQPFPSEIAAILSKYPQKDGYILSLFRVFANSLRFLSRAVPNLLDKESPLSLRERELVILRTTANNQCEYEWGVHAAIFAASAGFSPEQIDATSRVVVPSSCWSENDVLLLRCVDDLCAHGSITDDHLHQWQTHWDQAQQLEIIALCGTYHTVSFVANSARLAGEDFASTFPVNR